MASFVFVHGAWHGGWCWQSVIEELARNGHHSVAPDLPCDDVAAGWSEYLAVTLGAMDEIEGEVVVVGHSLAGGVIPLVAIRRPVRRLVFIGSFPPEPGKTLDEAIGTEQDLTDPRALVFRDARDPQGRYVWPNFEAARYAMYNDCSEESARWAYAHLRPQATRPFSERWPSDIWPEVPITFIVCADDRMGAAGPLRRVAKRRFGIDAVELAGGHSPFLCHPDEVVRALISTLS
ncbi:MAG TPA: alpha/beta hydrolase [Candidatus Limnocylindrales bacterium]|nr:alpha/beta hydrolase [Candidatus Limnocylindrales bacterium]